MLDALTPDALAAFLQVLAIDLLLAGDNAIVIGLAAAGLPEGQRTKAIAIGIGAATLMRIGFAAVAVELLSVLGLLLAGGLLLLWVCWKMWRELRASHHPAPVGSDVVGHRVNPDGTMVAPARQKTFLQAAWQIIVADVSMSLDNVLAVAGAAREHPWVLVFGLIFSIALMGAAAGVLARMLQKHRWIAYVGLAIILYVAIDMTVRGGLEVFSAAKAAAGLQ